MNVRILIVSVFSAIIVFGLGAGLGIFYQSKKNVVVVPPVQTQTMPESIKVLSSKLVPSITVRGKVTKIDPNTLTLMYQSDTRVIKMSSDAQVYALVAAKPTPLNKSNYVTKPASFADIKVDDNVELTARVLTNGQLEAFNTLIFPAPATPAPAVKK